MAVGGLNNAREALTEGNYYRGGGDSVNQRYELRYMAKVFHNIAFIQQMERTENYFL